MPQDLGQHVGPGLARDRIAVAGGGGGGGGVLLVQGPGFLGEAVDGGLGLLEEVGSLLPGQSRRQKTHRFVRTLSTTTTAATATILWISGGEKWRPLS